MKFIKCLLLLLLSGGFSAYSQDHLWKEYFSYYRILSVISSSTHIYAATNSSVFVYDVANGDIETITTLDGLKTQEISKIFYSEKFKKLIVGSNDGSIYIVDRTSNKINLINDIVNKKTIPPKDKYIRSFIENNGKLYIGTGYGVSVMNLNNNEFEDTYFIGKSGGNVVVIQIEIIDDWIYVLTRDEGIKRAKLNNPNLVDFNQWEVFSLGKWERVVSWNNQLFAVNELNGGRRVYKVDSEGFSLFATLPEYILDFKVVENNMLLVTTLSQTVAFDSEGEKYIRASGDRKEVGNFISSVMLNDKVYVGTNSLGLIEHNHDFPASDPNYISLKGPYSNSVFSILFTSEGMLFVSGGYTKEYNPHRPNLGSYGLSFYNSTEGWRFIPYSQLEGARSLTYASVNPKSPDYLWVSSFHSGLLEIKFNKQHLEDSDVKLYDNLNTGDNGLQKIPNAGSYVSVRVNGTAFDKEGNVWMTNSRVDNSLVVMLANGEWNSYSFDKVINNPSGFAFGPPTIDRNGTKWIPAYRNGLVGFNEKRSDKIMLINDFNGNLPDTDVVSIAIDKNNQLWIGTDKGLRIIPNVDDFLTRDQLTTNSIIIKEEGLPQELFYQQRITKIKVDGANNKWIAIEDAGVFLVSPNGQETLYRFTMENSPLPNNTINDIEIDESTGEIFFATNSGAVSFKGSNVTEAVDSYTDVTVFPNPVRPDFFGEVKISGLKDKSNIKITDVEGNLVFETTSLGGTILWDTHSFSGKKVGSGVYLIFITSRDGNDKTVKKIMIIR